MLRNSGWCGLAGLFVLSHLAVAAVSEQTVFFDVPDALEPSPVPAPTAALLAVPGYPDDADRLTLIARMFVPDPVASGPGPYPAVVIMHGSGGLWSNDIIANGLISQFDQWGELLADLGYLVLLPDSYNPRGIPGNFGSRRPHHDPAIDDHLCSPNYERPKDVVAALEFLTGREEFDGEHVALMGFSHGAQTCINAVVDASVDLGQYTVSYVDLVAVPNTNPVIYQEETVDKDVPSPVRIPDHLPFPKLGLFYYGGGSHFGYHGDAASVAAGRYMFDRRMMVLLFHGTSDSLLGVDDPDADPMTGDLYPIRQVLASSAHAQQIGVPDPLRHHFLFDQVGHSFDLATIAPQNHWNTQLESADQKAKRLSREEALKWIEFALRPPPPTTLATHSPGPGQVTLTFPSNPRLRYEWFSSPDLSDWSAHGNEFDGSGSETGTVVEGVFPGSRFYKLEVQPVPPPTEAPENSDFFKTCQDFSL